MNDPLPTKARTRKVKAAVPANLNLPFARLLVADEFRTEANGKVLAVGLYPDSVVVCQTPSDAAAPSKKHPIGINSLYFLVTIGGVVGKQKVSVSIGNSKPVEMEVEMKADHSANLIFGSRPLLIQSFGVKQVAVEFAGVKKVMEFELRRADTSDTASTAVKTSTKVKSRPRSKATPAVD